MSWGRERERETKFHDDDFGLSNGFGHLSIFDEDTDSFFSYEIAHTVVSHTHFKNKNTTATKNLRHFYVFEYLLFV